MLYKRMLSVRQQIDQHCEDTFKRMLSMCREFFSALSACAKTQSGE
jgi:hypothetical protein